jgi:tRNA threonylcarbamoyladenosine biosynthesis protein TsaE
MREFLSKSVEETKDASREFLDTLKPENKAIVVGLRGDLGSGKTTFVKMLAETLGIKETLTSPTFVIEKIYKLDPKIGEHYFSHLIHIDAYRLKMGEELSSIGFDEAMEDRNNLIMVEWPENVFSVLPEDTKYVDFLFIDDTTRKISWK